MKDSAPVSQTTGWQPIETAPRDGTVIDVRFNPATADRDSVGSLAEFWAPGCTRRRNPTEPVICGVIFENRHFRPQPIGSTQMPACDMSLDLTEWKLA